jgi:hypothetical protein
MGTGNRAHLVECVSGECRASRVHEAKSDGCEDGNVHRLGARRDGDGLVLAIDGDDQFTASVALAVLRGIVVGHAAVGVDAATTQR